jgi:hypothetical protein
MKTLQKTIWIPYLIIGIMLNSCTDTQPENNKIYFNYTNKTNENVELKLYDKNSINFKNISVFANSTTAIILKQNKGKGIGTPFLYEDNYAEKVVIKFETSNKCLVNYAKIKESKYYDNYLDSMLNSYGNILEYFIDSEELDKAILCE